MKRNFSGLLAITKSSIRGPLVRNAACRSAGTSGPTTAARYVAAFCGVSGTPAPRITELLGSQIPAPDRAADPPKVGAFSTTRTLSPRLAAVSAAVIPAAPEPTTTTSYSPSGGPSWMPAARAVADGSTVAASTPAPVPARTVRLDGRVAGAVVREALADMGRLQRCGEEGKCLQHF